VLGSVCETLDAVDVVVRRLVVGTRGPIRAKYSNESSPGLET
jgi:hypothetical protein